MTSSHREGPPPWRVAVAVGVLGMLAVGVCAVGSSPAATTQPPIRSTTTAVAAAPTTQQSSSTPAVTAPQATIASTVASATSTTSAPPPDVLPGDVFAHTQAALSAWGEFAATGDLPTVESTFVLDGPQYEQLASEADTLLATGVGLPAFEFLLTFPQVVATQGTDIATVQGTIVIAREGEVDSEVAWNIEMHWFPGEGRWRLFRATEAPT